MGLIKVTNKVENITGRWKKDPEKKVWVNKMLIEAERVRIDFQKGYFEQVALPFDLKVEYETVIPSPLLADGYLSKGIDFKDFSNQEKLTVDAS